MYLYMSLMYYLLGTGSMIVDKKYVAVTGGGAITITGPCFQSLTKKVICKFEHTETTGEIIDSNNALCPLPLFTRLGQHVIRLSENNGATFNFYAMINISKLSMLIVVTYGKVSK